jgi:probable rRNA maturation factor
VAAALDSRIREADLAIRIVGAKEGRALNRITAARITRPTS